MGPAQPDSEPDEVSNLAQTRQVRRLFHLNHDDGGQVSVVNQFVA
jgi:hypothetical protein